MRLARTVVAGVTAGVLMAGGLRVMAQDAPQRGSAVRLGNPNAPAAVQPSGTVTGRVYCSDTQRPAKFADVQLMQENTNLYSVRGAFQNGIAGTGPRYMSIAQGRTALDGSFSITGVPPGDYFAVGQAAGYVSATLLARQNNAPLRGGQVHVEANRSADVQVSVDRGAVVEGRVMFDDGTPATNVSVQLQRTDASTRAGAAGNGMRFIISGVSGSEMTDDRGMYRISGVIPGKYNVMTTILTEGTERSPGRRSGFPQAITVYAPHTMHRTDALAIEVRGTETLTGEDIQVALNGLHTVRGVLESKADSHRLTAGSVFLSDPADPALARMGMVKEDGTFALGYLPPGTYTLQLRGGELGAGSRYVPATVNAVVADADVALDAVLLDVTTGGPPVVAGQPQH